MSDWADEKAAEIANGMPVGTARAKPYIADALRAERKRCADMATKQLRNRTMLMCNQPMSGAAWDIRNAINSGRQS
jgi:hypothetical protein